ncbi:MAG: hypothetical protein DWI22_17135 [Planctomycetota bacterium]|nr:MAG: hypothetical protein DWI22_17135 [Planctomycetota bacterium]
MFLARPNGLLPNPLCGIMLQIWLFGETSYWPMKNCVPRGALRWRSNALRLIGNLLVIGNLSGSFFYD